jgi:hypothetical protein
MRRSLSLSASSWIAALVLAVASLFIVNFGPDYADPAARQGLFYAWFYFMPGAADMLFWPETAVATLGLVGLVYVLQYLALMASVTGLLALLKILNDFIGPPRHRRTLVRRRA